MKNKQILVVTPTLGNRPSLSRTVASVREIGSGDVCHVIVCPQVEIPSLEQQYPDLLFIAEPSGCNGIYPALNHAFNAFGHDFEYMTFINDDDCWLPAYRKLIDAVISEPSLDLVYGKVSFVDGDMNLVGIQACSARFCDFVPLLHHDIVLLTQQAVIFKSSLFFMTGGFDGQFKLVSDTKFWATLSKQALDVRYFDNICAQCSQSEGRLSCNSDLQARETLGMLGDYPCSKVVSFMAMLRFRLANIGLYVNRIFRFKRIRHC